MKYQRYSRDISSGQQLPRLLFGNGQSHVSTVSLNSSRILLLLVVWLSVHSAPRLDVLQASYTQRWGASTISKFEIWRKLVDRVAPLGEMDRIRQVNNFFNQNIQFEDDPAIWNQVDYWATPLETIGMGTGDCEDFAIAKYFTLLQAGIRQDKLRLIYVRARVANSEIALAHMVLAYYPIPTAVPMVMDNLNTEVLPATLRQDLAPVFSFNRVGIFVGIGGTDPAAAITGRLSRWEDLLRRAKAEGFE